MWLTEYMHVLENGDLLLQRCKRLAQSLGRSTAVNLRCNATYVWSKMRIYQPIYIHVAFHACILLYCVIQSAAVLPYSGQIDDVEIF